MRNYSLLVIVGSTLFLSVSAVGQDSTISSGKRPPGRLQPANVDSTSPHRVVLRPPSQLASTAQLVSTVRAGASAGVELQAGEGSHATNAGVTLPTVDAPHDPRVIHINQRHIASSEPLPVHACVHCAKPAPTPVRRFLDRFTSGVDYIFFGVTATSRGAGKTTRCDCDQLDSCDASVEPIWGVPDASQQPVWNHAHQGESGADLSDYFDQRPRRETRPAVPALPRSETSKIGGAIVSPPQLSAPQGDDGARAIGERSGRSTGGVLTPATKIPPRFPVAPILDAPEDRPSKTSSGKGNSGTDWIPPTNPFEDDPLPRK